MRRRWSTCSIEYDGVVNIDERIVVAEGDGSRVEVWITYDTSVAPHKANEPYLYVLHDLAKPDAGKLYFTQAEWDAFVLGVRDGEFDLDEDGNLPPVPADQVQGLAAGES